MGNTLSYTIPAKEPPDPIIYRTSKDDASKTLLLLSLMDASSKAASFPNIDLSGERIMNTKLRKSRGKYVKSNI